MYNLPFKQIIVCCYLLFTVLAASAQSVTLERIEPPNWWANMANTQLQLLVYGKNIGFSKPSIVYEGVKIKSVSTVENKNYLFIDLAILRSAESGIFQIVFSTVKGQELIYDYELKTKKVRSNDIQTIDGSDVMYLITPDRFANGNVANDSTEDTLEKVNRDDSDGRHGGDIQGIIDHLDYIDSLGITTLWLNPFLENDQSKYSYHGYGISDFYKTDSRFGANKDFKHLVDLCHGKGMKVIMDQVFNHCGSGHWWMNDLPSPDWLNQWDVYTQTSFTNILVSDPYSSKSDHDLHTKGWFDTNLPDLNQENDFLATYLIQNSIWWIEFADLDGIRMDTYPYPDKDVMAQWVQAVTNEYPHFYIVAETSEEKASSLSYWNRKGSNKDGYTPYVNSVSDYPLYYAILKAFGNSNDTYRIYESLAYDFLYGEPFNNKVFNGNHDVPRLYTQLNEDKSKVKLSMAFILTTRGIPQLYYGDELLFKGNKPDGILRKDFPGGWNSDIRNAFSKEGRTKDENDMFNYISTILKWRKNAVEIHKGKLIHYKPKNDVYVYFRYFNDEKTMIILNNSDISIDDFGLDHYKESLQGYTKGTDVISKTNFTSLKSIGINANSALIVKLRN